MPRITSFEIDKESLVISYGSPLANTTGVFEGALKSGWFKVNQKGNPPGSPFTLVLPSTRGSRSGSRHGLSLRPSGCYCPEPGNVPIAFDVFFRNTPKNGGCPLGFPSSPEEGVPSEKNNPFWDLFSKMVPLPQTYLPFGGY